jgi:FtsP/CotA-like multicopper oxidase with cupredoxin domain
MRTRVLYISTIMITGLIAALPLTASLRSGTQEIRLVVKEMTFYLADDPDTANPMIRVKPGRSVRIVLQNLDQGITHNFVVKGLPLSLPPVKGKGTASVLFRIPDRAGTYFYQCVPHARMMNGVFEVR